MQGGRDREVAGNATCFLSQLCARDIKHHCCAVCNMRPTSLCPLPPCCPLSCPKPLPSIPLSPLLFISFRMLFALYLPLLPLLCLLPFRLAALLLSLSLPLPPSSYPPLPPAVRVVHQCTDCCCCCCCYVSSI